MIWPAGQYRWPSRLGGRHAGTALGFDTSCTGSWDSVYSWAFTLGGCPSRVLEILSICFKMWPQLHSAASTGGNHALCPCQYENRGSRHRTFSALRSVCTKLSAPFSQALPVELWIIVTSAAGQSKPAVVLQA